MRHTKILFPVLSVALLLAGCESNSSSTSGTNAKLSHAKEKVEDAAEATTAAAEAKRDEYAREIRRRLDELDVKYEELKARAASAEGRIKQDLEKQDEEAALKRDAAAKKLDELKESGADRWEIVKEQMENVLDDLKKMFE